MKVFNDIKEVFEFLIEFDVLKNSDNEANFPYDPTNINKSLNFNSRSLFRNLFNNYLIDVLNIVNIEDEEDNKEVRAINNKDYLTEDLILKFLRYNKDQADKYREEQEKLTIEKHKKIEEINKFIQRLNNSIDNKEEKYIPSNHEKDSKLEINRQENFEKQLFEIKNSENQFWKGFPMDKVVNHFLIMTSKKNKKGEAFLSNEQLISFLRKGFLNDNTQPIQKVNCTSGEKGFVILRFYDFWNEAVSNYGYPQKKKDFIELFINCFNNWPSSTVTSYFKANKVKEKW